MRPGGVRPAVVVGALLLGGAAVGAYWRMAVRPRIDRIEGRFVLAETGRPAKVKGRVDAVSDFDREFSLPIDPLGLVAQGGELVAASRAGGLLRIRPIARDEIETAAVTVREPIYGQTLALWALAANGSEVVGVTDAAWFQRSGSVFTLHDPASLALKGERPAPPLLGCLAWDGAGYWAATRKNTEASGEEAHLYRLDPSLKVTRRYPPLGPGCQGMAWDGSRLWVADVFDDTISVLDFSAGEPRVVSRSATSIRYLSGLAVLGDEIWITEYGTKTLRRLNPRLRTAWLSETDAPPLLAAAPAEERPAPRDERREERPKKSVDRAETAFPKTGEREMSALEWSVEAVEGEIRGTWRIHFGAGLFGGRAPEGAALTVPVFARYTFTVKGGSLERPVERTFDAEPGENVRAGVPLATGLGPGTYRVELFLHVQCYEDGTPRILNANTRTLEVEL